MIAIKRTRAPKELAETNRKFREATAGMDRKRAYDFYKEHERKYQYNTPETKEAFRKMTRERCSFCTGLISSFSDAMTIEHIRTKRDYPRKIFQWSNLLCACSTCNNKRGTKAYIPGKYLDPTKLPDVEKYFCYEPDGRITVNEDLDEAEKERAAYMIKLYRLDREELNGQRREFLRDLMTDDHYYEILKNLEALYGTSQNIIFLSVFAYYRRCKEAYGE